MKKEIDFKEILNKYKRDTDHFADQDFIEEDLLEFAKEIWNAAIITAAKHAKGDMYIKKHHKGAKARKLEIGEEFDIFNNDMIAMVDKETILKLKK